MSQRPARSSSRRLGARGDTRQTLIDTALNLLSDDKSFDGLSLRELTRAVGIVPTAFYRHFPGMDELGLALVDESFGALRKILDDARKESRNTDKMVRGIVRALMKHVQKHRIRFRFIAAERVGGNSKVRDSIRREMRLVQSELALELARFPYLKEWSTADLHMMASLALNTLVAVAEEMLDRHAKDKNAERELSTLAEKQLRLILLGVPHWRSDNPS